MTTLIGRAFVGFAMALLTLGATSNSLARIHGTVVRIDAKRHAFLLHHAPFAQMPMAMTMEIRPLAPGALRQLHVGERIDVTVDTAAEPWIGTDIRPARSGEK